MKDLSYSKKFRYIKNKNDSQKDVFRLVANEKILSPH